jgi:phage shock protein PspC (stress-responsive transcriptional regulator)
MTKKLTRSKNKIVGGVCAGIAEYFDIDVTVVRIGFVVAAFFAFSSVLIYIVCLIMMPQKENVEE